MQPDRAADMEKARKIVARFGSFVGPHGTMPENVAMAIADGIALGRKEGIAMAAEAIAHLKDDGNPNRLPANPAPLRRCGE
jgi:hypothetical protein